LPQGVLDVFTADQVMDCNTEEESVALVRLLPPTQAALLDWAVNLMADVVQQESSNKMNARNIAMVFAPNMTQVFVVFLSIAPRAMFLVVSTSTKKYFFFVDLFSTIHL
jgi:hypothetical protein